MAARRTRRVETLAESASCAKCAATIPGASGLAPRPSPRRPSSVVELDAYPGLRFSGRVVEMAALASPRRGTRSGGSTLVRHIPVRILIEDWDKRILPGLSASVDVIVSRKKRGVLVPREALRYESGPNASTSVRVVEGGMNRKRLVVVQGLSDTEALIRSGLQPGDQVLLRGLP